MLCGFYTVCHCNSLSVQAHNQSTPTRENGRLPYQEPLRIERFECRQLWGKNHAFFAVFFPLYLSLIRLKLLFAVWLNPRCRRHLQDRRSWSERPLQDTIVFVCDTTADNNQHVCFPDLLVSLLIFPISSAPLVSGPTVIRPLISDH